MTSTWYFIAVVPDGVTGRRGDREKGFDQFPPPPPPPPLPLPASERLFSYTKRGEDLPEDVFGRRLPREIRERVQGGVQMRGGVLGGLAARQRRESLRGGRAGAQDEIALAKGREDFGREVRRYAAGERARKKLVESRARGRREAGERHRALGRAGRDCSGQEVALVGDHDRAFSLEPREGRRVFPAPA